MTKEEYHAYDAVSNSSLSWVLPESGGSPKKYENYKLFPPDDLDSVEVELGTCAHLLVETGTLDSFEVVNKPGPSVSAICDELVNHPAYASMTPIQINDEIVRIARARDFQPRWGDDAIVKNILKDGGDYIAKLTTSTKKLVDPETMTKLEAIKMSLDETAPWLFEPSLPPPNCAVGDDFEVLKEKVILFVHKEVECKALLDIVVVNHSRDTIDIYDLKTVSMPLSIYLGYEIDGEQVQGKFVDRGIHRQLAFYNIAVVAAYIVTLSTSTTVSIIACETKGVFESKIHTLNNDIVIKGLRRANYGIELLKEYNLISMGGL
jgi:hypothetical protein